MVRLEPMGEADFRRYLETAVQDYAQAHIKAGDCDADEALALAQADYDSLLPQGLATTGQHLLSIHADGSPAPIGLIWFESRERRGKRSAYIYDFVVRPEFRGKGYGAATLRAVEEVFAEMGIKRVSLNVMGWNTQARALYERHGFTVAGIGMTKVLG